MKLSNLNKQKEKLKKDENLTSDKTKHQRKKDLAYQLSGISPGAAPPSEEEKGKREEKEEEVVLRSEETAPPAESNRREDIESRNDQETDQRESSSELKNEGSEDHGAPEPNRNVNRGPGRPSKIPTKLQWLHELDKKLYNTYVHTNMDIVRNTSAKIDAGRLGLLKEYSIILGIDAQEVLSLAIDIFREKYDVKIEEIRKMRKEGYFKN